MIPAGAARKTPLWRLGAWLGGAAILLGLLLARTPGGVLLVLLVLVGGFALTAPYGWSLVVRGGEPHVGGTGLVRLRPVGIITYAIFTLLYRVPEAIGDRLYTQIWRGVHRRRERRSDALLGGGRQSRSPVILPPAPHAAFDDEPTWPGGYPHIFGEHASRRAGLLHRLFGR